MEVTMNVKEFYCYPCCQIVFDYNRCSTVSSIKQGRIHLAYSPGEPFPL